MSGVTVQRLHGWARRGLRALVHASGRLRLPGPSVLPAAGAVVGVYSGLLAGVFANLIGLVDSAVSMLFHLPEVASVGGLLGREVRDALAAKNWHFELALVAGLPALGALALARLLPPGPEQETVRRRLRVLALLALGALGLYYPLVGLSLLNRVLGRVHGHPEDPAGLPWWALLVAPTLGGLVVGRLLRRRPELHGHGIPEVVQAVRLEREGLRVRGGLLKIVASAVTIGSGGSAGREGPIVYGGGAVASGVARTLGFSRKELAVLLASGAGAGIAASFNAPMAGALFALEIILREFEVKSFSPIILASVSATLVGRGVMGATPMLRRLPYQMVSGWEVVPYVGLGLACGLLAFALIRLLHRTEDFFGGRVPVAASAWLARRPLSARAALGGALVGALALWSPAVWGTGHHYSNLATGGQLGLVFLVTACALKLVATAVTIGSGGSGGTFFPATVIGAMAGGAFGEVVHTLMPRLSAPSGAYALVGMGGVVAGFTRGPLTAMMMVYELTGNYRIILPLMLTCTLASALCHVLVERRQAPGRSGHEVLRGTPVRALALRLPALEADRSMREVVDSILASGETALPVLDAHGQVYGLVQLHELHEVWRDETLVRMLKATDIAHRVAPVGAQEDLYEALRIMDREDLDVLPVADEEDGVPLTGLLTRAAIRRHLLAVRAREHSSTSPLVAPTELEP